MPGATKPAAKKSDMVKLLQDKLSEAKSTVIVDYSTLTVKEKTQLYSDVKKSGGSFFVAKNTLIYIAMGKKPELKDSLRGMNGLLFGIKDAIDPLKTLVQFHEKTEKLIIKKGVMDGQILSEEQVLTLSKLPSKPELISMLINRLQVQPTNW